MEKEYIQLRFNEDFTKIEDDVEEGNALPSHVQQEVNPAE